VTEEAHDQVRGDAEPPLSFEEGAVWAHDYRLQGHAPVDVGPGVEEDLGVAHALGSSPGELGEGQIVEVPLVDEHPAGLVVEVQEGLEVREVLY
jgi:hypothetical protein